MTKPMRLDEFTRLPAAARAITLDGLSGVIDSVTEGAHETHRFLRYQWFAAAIAAYGGAARTIVVEADGEPVIALPMIGFGPAAARLASVPGCYWPFRSFPARLEADDTAFDALLGALAGAVNALRIGPVYDDDPALVRLLEAAETRGWARLDRFIADSFVLDMAARRAEGVWPRNSTLRKNRFHEKHLAEHGTPDWTFVSGPDWSGAMFDALAAIERKSWIADRTNGGDAKFTRTGHGAFWRGVATDPALAEMMWAALLTIDGVPAAFSFDLNTGALKYAIANSYDPAFARHSPGKLLYYRNLIRALDDGVAKVDWGAGDSGYKSVIGAQRGPAIRDWLLVRPGLPALAARALASRWRKSGRPEPARIAG